MVNREDTISEQDEGKSCGLASACAISAMSVHNIGNILISADTGRYVCDIADARDLLISSEMWDHIFATTGCLQNCFFINTTL